MDTLIEKEGRYLKECNVVILPTEDMTNIVKTPHLKYHKAEDIFYEKTMKYQHLYITSDDEIKESDWIYCSLNKGKVYQCKNIAFNNKIWNNSEDNVFKIIATTDKSLLISYRETTKFTSMDRKKSLSQPSHKFIQAFVRAGGIDKVLVEYEFDEITTRLNFKNKGLGYWTPGFSKNNIYKLKTDSHNTITIKSVEEKIYTRKEVEALCHEAYNSGYAEASGLCCGPMQDPEENSFDWVKENL